VHGARFTHFWIVCFQALTGVLGKCRKSAHAGWCAQTIRLMLALDGEHTAQMEKPETPQKAPAPFHVHQPLEAVNYLEQANDITTSES